MKLLTPTVLTYVKVVLLVAVVPAIIGFIIVLAERRLMGFMQVRLGPNRVGPKGMTASAVNAGMTASTGARK